jgi:signal transduction histidine kinase
LTVVNLTNINKAEVRVKKIDTKILKKFYVVDTLKEVKKKKGFFKKVGELFSSKDEGSEFKLVKGDSANANDSSVGEADKKFNALSNSIQKYYQNSINEELKLRNRLNGKEKLLAETNLDVINQVHNLLKELIDKDENAERKSGLLTYTKALNSRANIVRLSWISFIVLLIIIGILVYNIRRSVQYEVDIVHAKNAAEKLAQTKSRFLSNMSHEIRSPLTAIIGFTEQLEKHEYDESKKKQLHAIRTSSDHLLHTVNDILDFSKLDAGKLQIQKTNFNLANEIDETFYSCTVLANKKKLAFNLNKQLADDTFVIGDAHRLRQVLYNLISNALKFTEKGSVTVTANVIDKGNQQILLKVDVIDTGVGIPTNQLNFIFEEFAQATTNDIDGRRSIKGTGLGLAITKMLVKVQSEVGKGSVFTVTIPFTITNSSEIVVPKQTSTVQEFYFGKRALIIEDNEINVLLLTLLLNKYGITYDIAEDGEKGLHLFNTNSYNIILTDINIPKLTGDKLATIIRSDADASKAHLPIIALTASIISDDIELYHKSGINEILMKPFKEADFNEVLVKYLV